MSRIRFLAAMTALVALGACATATPYQAAVDGQKRGYFDQQVEDNRWQVGFAGNSLTDRQTVETYLLYRAAELTDQKGFDYFKVVQRETDADRRIVSTGFGYDPYYSHFFTRYHFYGRHGRLRGYPRGFYRSSFRYYDPFWDNDFDYREIVRYEAFSEIFMGKGEKPDDPAYFNADEVLMNLSNRIQRPAA